MAESRRVEFQTISTPKEEKKPVQPTLIPRFNLALGESTSTTCPEFSFTELLKKEKVDREPAVNDAFGDEEDCHDEVAALARKFEEKYGPKPGAKKRKLKCLEDDYYDLGDGYDENDPFIDNTEAYDEMVPSCLTTIHGGFYINRGALDFKTLYDQDDSEAEFIPVVRKRGRPRKIADSDDSREDGEEFKKRKLKKKKGKEGLEGEKKKRRKLSLGPDGEKIIKRRKLLNADKKKKTSPTVKELLKQQTASTGTASAAINGSVEDHAPSSPHLSPSSDVAGGAEKGGEGSAAVPGEGEEVQLPSDLPADLETAIVDIKKAAKVSKEGKCKFFSPHVNRLLLDIELASRQLAAGKRPTIYAHLADHLPCGKETLIKRAKKLRENQQDDQLKVPIQRLKEVIDRVMPALQEQHDRDVARARLENKEKREGGEGVKEEGGGGVNTESDEDDKNPASNTGEGQSRKGNRDPRKKFKWTPDIKSLLCEIVRIKMLMFETYKFRNQTAEEYLKTFLDNEIKILWPQGWIQTRTLFKETRSVHGKWTNPPKPKRQVLMSRATASPTPPSSQAASTGMAEGSPSVSTPAAVSGDLEVIEVSDIEEPPTPVSSKEKVKAVTSYRDDGPRMPSSAESLKFSPNSMEAVAAATAAAVAAAVSSPKSEAGPSLGERRPHLMSEMLKRPGSTEASVSSSASVSASFSRPPPASLPKTPPGGEVGISPFMAEFSRYLSNSSNSMPPSSSPPPPPRQGPSPAPPSQTTKTVTAATPTGRSEDSRGHILPSGWMKMEEGEGGERSRKVNLEGPASRPPNAHSGHKGAPGDMSPYGHYKMMSSVLKAGAELSSSSGASGAGGKTRGDIVCDQILAKIQAEIDATRVRTSTSVSPSSSQHRQQAPPPAHSSSQYGPVFPSTPKELVTCSPAISRPPSLPATSSSKQAGMNTASPAMRQQGPPSMHPNLAKQSGVSPGSVPRPAGGVNPASVSRPSSGVNTASVSRPPGANPSMSRPPGVNTSVSRPQGGNTATVSRSPPVARQSPKVVTRPSPGQVQQMSATPGRQSPKTLPRPQQGNVSRPSPGGMARPPQNNVARSSPGDMPRQSPNSVTRLSPSNVSRTPANSVTRPSNVTRVANTSGDQVTMTTAGAGLTRSTAGVAPPSQSLMSSYHQHSSSPSPSLPSQRPPISLPGSVPGVPVRPLSLSAHKKPSTAPPPSNLAGAGRPPQPTLTRVTTGQGQGMKASVGQGQMQARMAAVGGQSLLRKVSPSSGVPPQRGMAVSHSPEAGGHRVGPPPQSPQNLPRAPPGGIMSRGQLVGSTSTTPRLPVRPGSASVDMHNRTSPPERSQGDKAAAALTLVGQAGNQGSKPAGSTAHSRPSPNPAGPPTNTLRLQQPAAAAAASKGVVNKASLPPSGAAATPPHPLNLDPQAVVSGGLFNHRPVFRPLHSLSTPRFKDPPKPPPGFNQ